MRIVCISDTHTFHKNLDLPEGDVLLHAGDLTNIGKLGDVRDFAAWIRDLPYKRKIVIAGNHDFCFQNDAFRMATLILQEAGVTYLQDDWTVIQNTKRTYSVYGTPWQPWFHDWAFNLAEEELERKWNVIPAVDILVVHGPPHGYLDTTKEGVQTGSPSLTEWMKKHKPKLVVCGHIHEDRGFMHIPWEDGGETYVVNASCVTRTMKMQESHCIVLDVSEEGIFTPVDLY